MTDSVAVWSSVLERMEQSLGQWLERTAEVPPSPASSGGEGFDALIDQRDEQWQSRLERLEREAASAENGLDADRVALHAWLDAIASARGRLA